MSLTVSANRFLSSRIHGWNGVSWDLLVARGAFLATQTEDQNRTLLINPRHPLNQKYATIAVNTLDNVYLVGQPSNIMEAHAVSQGRLLRRAPKICHVSEFSYSTAASGAKINPARQTLHTYFGDIEPILFSPDRVKFPGHLEGSTKIVLPLDAVVVLGNNIEIDDALYEVQGIAHDKGFTYCTVTIKVHGDI